MFFKYFVTVFFTLFTFFHIFQIFSISFYFASWICAIFSRFYDSQSPFGQFSGLQLSSSKLHAFERSIGVRLLPLNGTDAEQMHVQPLSIWSKVNRLHAKVAAATTIYRACRQTAIKVDSNEIVVSKKGEHIEQYVLRTKAQSLDANAPESMEIARGYDQFIGNYVWLYIWLGGLLNNGKAIAKPHKLIITCETPAKSESVTLFDWLTPFDSAAQ